MKRGFLNKANLKTSTANDGNKRPASSTGNDCSGSNQVALLPLVPPITPEDRARKPGIVNIVENMFVNLTIPGRNAGAPRDPDGHSEWLLMAKATKDKVLNAPGYPRPIPKPRRPDMFVVKSTPNIGLGVFATCDISVNELIFSERPLLVQSVPSSMTGNFPNNFSQASMKQQFSIRWIEMLLQNAVGRMSPEDYQSFMSLANCHTKDGSGPLFGICRTNGFGLAYLYDGPDTPPGEGTSKVKAEYSAVCKIASRINHSCMPNVYYAFKRSSFSLQFCAARDIKAGEQLFYSYCDVGEPVAVRRQELQSRYGFVCDCPACVNATPETDLLRQEYDTRLLKYGEEIRHRPLHHILQDVFVLQRDMVKEGLHTQAPHYLRVLRYIQTCFQTAGITEQAELYSKEVERYQAIVKDED